MGLKQRPVLPLLLIETNHDALENNQKISLQLLNCYPASKGEIMSVLYLSLAIIFEVIGTIAMKQSAITENTPLIGLTIVAYLAAFLCLWLCLKTMPLSLAYATWCGFGIAITTIAGLYLFNEKIDWIGYLGLTAIILGIVLIYGFSSLNSQ